MNDIFFFIKNNNTDRNSHVYSIYATNILRIRCGQYATNITCTFQKEYNDIEL